MALMFPRLARNFIRNGYFPTDEPTLERALSALAPSPGSMSILDPCAGEGVAIAEAAHALGREQVQAFAVEYDAERARHARQLVDRCIHGDLMDTLISRQSFGLLWLNPPYGDLSKDVNGNIGYSPCPSVCLSPAVDPVGLTFFANVSVSAIAAPVCWYLLCWYVQVPLKIPTFCWYVMLRGDMD